MGLRWEPIGAASTIGGCVVSGHPGWPCQLPQPRFERVEVHRLGEELGSSKVARTTTTLVVPIGGYHHHRQIGAALLDLSQEL